MAKTKEQKRWEAEDRRAEYERRSIEEQLVLIDQRPGDSTGEKFRLAEHGKTAKPPKKRKKVAT